MTKENNKVKNLNVSQINKAVKRLDDVKVEVITIGEKDYDLKVNQHFKNTKVQEIFEDLVRFVDVANTIEDEKEKQTFLEQSEIYLLVLLIDKFTSLDVPEDIAKRIAFANNLIDLDILAVIIDKLPLAEVDRAGDFIAKQMQKVEDNVTTEYEEFMKLYDQEVEQAMALDTLAKEEAKQAEDNVVQLTDAIKVKEDDLDGAE